MQVIRIEQYHSRRFREAMRIYLTEFHSSRLPISKIRALLKTGSYQLFVTEDTGGILALALVWVSPRPAFVHLDYLAVQHEEKGRGIGTALYRWLIGHLGEFSPRAQLLTLEVEDDLLGFYQRNQTKILQDVPYLFPARSGALPMHLMVYDRLERRTLDRADVQALIRTLYRGIHHRGADDALLRSFITHVPQRVALV
jgi:hypothetical protein